MQVYAARRSCPILPTGLTLAWGCGANSSVSLDHDGSCTLAGCDGARFPCREVVAEVESRNPSLAAPLIATSLPVRPVSWSQGPRALPGNGGYPPFAPEGQASPLPVCVTGGTQVGFSNITLVFGMPASGQFAAQVTCDPSLVSSGCPSASYTPATTTGFMVTGSASITGNGGHPPFAPQGQLSPLTVCVTGETQARFSNVTLVFGTPASGHFGSQAINGAVRVPVRVRE
jgi:hypothetical protein